uniref:mRNA decay activator protein ZFP36 n=1 Tax=Anas platyrhynchos platyrhynchos TaxID=8840 RepID=A0A493U3T0_ANAPP
MLAALTLTSDLEPAGGALPPLSAPPSPLASPLTPGGPSPPLSLHRLPSSSSSSSSLPPTPLLAPPEASPSPPASPPSLLYKTELCRPFSATGRCRYGSRCQFAHGPGELRGLRRHPKYRTQPCSTFLRCGSCPYGPRCHFLHGPPAAPAASRCLTASRWRSETPYGKGGGRPHPLLFYGGAPPPHDFLWGGWHRYEAPPLHPLCLSGEGGAPFSAPPCTFWM